MNETSRELWGLGLFLVVCFAGAALGGLSTASSVSTWYPTIAKPSWTPPSWLFGPVWTVLYAAMAVAGWLVWKRVGLEGGKVALSLFALQLVLNVAWSFCFFGLKSPGAGFVDIVLLLGSVVATMIVFWGVTPVAGWLFVPYALWVAFAAALNLAILRLS